MHNWIGDTEYIIIKLILKMKVGKKMTEKEIDRLYDILETVVDDDQRAALRHAILLLEKREY